MSGPGAVSAALANLLQTQIRDAATIAGQNVDTNRIDPIDEPSQLPRVLITTASGTREDADREQVGQSDQFELRVIVECAIAAGGTDIDLALMPFADAVFAVVMKGLGVQQLADGDPTRENISAPRFNSWELAEEEGAERGIAVFRMEFLYRVAITWVAGDPSEIVPHTSVDVRMDQPPEDAHTDAQHTFTVPSS